MVKAGGNRFGCIGCLVTKASFMSGKVDVVAFSDASIDLNYMVHMFQYDFSHHKFHGTDMTENVKLTCHHLEGCPHLPGVRSH